MSRSETLATRLRSLDPHVVDALTAAVFAVVGLTTVYGQEIRDDQGLLRDGFREPGLLTALTVLAVCAPIAFRRRAPVPALAFSAAALVAHIVAGWPEGALPLAVLFLTYNVGERCSLRVALGGLAIVWAAVVLLGFSDSPGLDTVGVISVCAQFAAACAIGIAVRNRREASDARVREVDERSAAERQHTARVLAEERLRIAQELHDVVAHAMSVIAVQAGVGAHVLDDRPEQARQALQAISTTSRGALADMRRLLGVLRDDEGNRSSTPAPGLADLPALVEEVRAAGVPVTLQVEGDPDGVPAGVELSAYRVAQESLTNVIKHAGRPTRVEVTVRHQPGLVLVEVVDDGRGLAARPPDGAPPNGGHGLLGMRERAEMWGGGLSAGPAPGGGYRVAARLPYGDAP